MYLIRAEAKRTGLASPTGVLTTLAVANQTVMVIGPGLGGLLINWGGWRATFAVNIPLSLACVVLGALVLPRHTVLDRERRAGTSPHLDPVGILLFAATLVSLLIFLMDIHVGYLWLLVVALVCGGGFVWWELRETRHALPPFIDPHVLAGNRPLVVTYLRAMLASTVSYTFMYGFTQWLEDGRNLDPSQAGMLLLPSFAMGILVSLLTGRSPAIRAKLMVGACSQVIGCGLILFVTGHSVIGFLLGLALLMGVPQGLNSLALQNSLYQQAEPSRIGASTGLMRTFNYLGAIIAAAASGIFFPVRATTPGMHGLALVALACAGLFLLITIVDPSLGRVDQALREGEATAHDH
jgi:predicted MFS family arabinose efflux permease